VRWLEMYEIPSSAFEGRIRGENVFMHDRAGCTKVVDRLCLYPRYLRFAVSLH